MIIGIEGPIPSKKNMYRPHKGGMHRDVTTKRALDAITLQIQQQMRAYGRREPFPRDTAIEIWLYPKTRRQDRDNMVTALLDCMVAAGVFVDDSIAQWNGKLTVHPACVSSQPRATIRIWG